MGVTIAVSAPVQTRILEQVRSQPGISIAALLLSEPEVRANDIYVMVTREQIYVNLYAVPLVEHWRVQLYPDRHSYEASPHVAIKLPQRLQSHPTPLVANTKLLWDGRLWTLVNLGETTTTLLPEIGSLMQLPTGFFLQLLSL